MTDLEVPGVRQGWAVKLAVAHHKAAATAHDEIDSALLDEIQIVTAWMKQRTREGSYLQLPEGVGPEAAATEIDGWLGALVGTRQLRVAA